MWRRVTRADADGDAYSVTFNGTGETLLRSLLANFVAIEKLH